MIEREIPKDIRKYEAKFAGPFTFRQTVCVVIGGTFSLITYNTFGKLFVPNVRGYLCFIVAAPALLVGWYKPYGMPLEKYLFTIIKTLVLAPTKRVYKTENIYDIKTPEEVAKNKKKRKKATPSKKKEFKAYK